MQYIVLWIGLICSVSLLSILTVTTILAGHTEAITRLPKAYPGTLVTIKQYNILRLVIWDSSKTPVQTRLNITWVCKRWREIALNDATLWTAIWFRPSGLRIERAFAWLDRSKKAPVDVRLDCGGVFIPGLEDQLIDK